MGGKVDFPRSSILIGAVLAVGVVVMIAVVYYAAMTRDSRTGISDVFIYDLEKYQKTDPALIKYEETGSIKTGFQQVFAITIDSRDRVYVSGDKAIRVFSSEGDTLSELSLTYASRCLAVADDGTIYAGLGDHVEVYDPSGTRKAKWASPGPDSILTSIEAYEGEIFVADAGGRVVLRYDESGNLLNRLGERDEERNIPGLVVPGPYLDLAVAPDGLLRVTNPGVQQIEAYTFDGYMELSWGKPSPEIDGFSGCHNPVNFAILSDGRFVTCEKGLPRVKVYTPEGVFESVVAGTERFDMTEEDFISDGETDQTKVGLDVAVDSQGRVYVLDPVEKAVRIFTSKDD
jgi:hypothetical protein